MANAYGQTISGEVATTLGDNSRKTRHDTFNYGTPTIYPLVIVNNDSNWTDFANSDSSFHKVMTVIQSRAEIYGIGEVEDNDVTILVNWNTLAQDDTASENTGSPQVDTGDLDYLAAEILAATGINVKIWHGKFVGTEIDYDMD